MTAATALPSAGPGHRRQYLVALVLLALGGGLLLLAASRPWGTAEVTEPGLGALSLTITGGEVAGAVVAVGVTALAGLGGLLATRRTGRAIVGALLALAGIAAAGAALSFGRGGAADVSGVVSERVGVPVTSEVTITPWWVVALGGGLVVAVVGVLAVARGGRWPAMGSRYEREGAGSGEVAAAPADTWAALDRGEDPTL